MLADQQHTRPAKVKHDVIMMALLESLQNSQSIRNETISFLRRQQIVEQVKDYLRLHQDCTVTIHELCNLCHVSRRTLQYSFETILGISPLRYLRLSRLNGARRELMMSQTESVADIAEKWGFWHLSQFTQDYKQLFNELPSITLSKSA
jgi:AraC family ethanolamine operon transcriptional activator